MPNFKIIGKLKIGIAACLLISCTTNPLPESGKALSGVKTIETVLTDSYAPGDFKKSSYGWNREQELSKLRDRIRLQPKMQSASTKTALLQFFGSLRDLHSRPIFKDNKEVWLGLHIKRTNSGYFIAWIDKSVFPSSVPSVEVGDEVKSFNGVDINIAIGSVKTQTQWFSTPAFEQNFSEFFLTYRSAADWSELPTTNSPVSLGVIRKGNSKQEVVELKWLDIQDHPLSADCPFWGKTKLGYLPELGKVVWSSPAENIFKSYIFEYQGRNFGYVRFHSYKLTPEMKIQALCEWEAVVSKFQQHKIKNLVFDQLGNGGGDFIFGYSILSRLTDKPLRTPLQKYIVDSTEVVGFGKLKAIAKDLEVFSKIKTNAEAKRVLSAHPLFINNLNYISKDLIAVKNFIDFFGYFIKDAKLNSQRHLTKPHFQFQEFVMPAVGPKYLGPIVMLIDEMNISAAEYIAATLKDNRRAILLGTTTAGAGGDQRVIVSDSSNELAELGLSGFSYTVTLGERISQKEKWLGPIENKGVTPDQSYKITYEDLTSGFSSYREVILQRVR